MSDLPGFKPQSKHCTMFACMHECMHVCMCACVCVCVCVPDGLSVVQCSLRHVIGIVFLTQFRWHEANVLDNWQLAELPQSGGSDDPFHLHEFKDPRALRE